MPGASCGALVIVRRFRSPPHPGFRRTTLALSEGQSTDARMQRDRAMAEFNFTLTIKGAIDDPTLDALYEAGCDDATFSTKGETTFAEFDREASSFLEAVVSAISDVESVEGMEVLHVEPDVLVWASEIAERMGRSRQSVDMLIKGQRGPGGFPSPTYHSTRNPLWQWSEVEAWFEAYEGRRADAERAAVIGAVNGALQARHALRAAPQAGPLRKVVSQLLAS